MNYYFSLLHQLRSLELRFNKIAIVEKYAWSGLSNLNYLGLEGNRLKSLDVSGLPSVESIRAQGNPHLSINSLYGFKEGSLGMYSYKHFSRDLPEGGTVYKVIPIDNNV